MSLEHNRPHCPSGRGQELVAGLLYWRCGHCQASAYHRDSVAEAAIRENQLGVTLRQLSNAGDYLNLSEDEEQWRW